MSKRLVAPRHTKTWHPVPREIARSGWNSNGKCGEKRGRATSHVWNAGTGDSRRGVGLGLHTSANYNETWPLDPQPKAMLMFSGQEKKKNSSAAALGLWDESSSNRISSSQEEKDVPRALGNLSICTI